MTAKLLLGRWQEVFDPAIEVDATIVDAPYSERVATGFNKAKAKANRRKIDYGHWTAGNVGEFVAFWAPRTRGWFVTITDHVLVKPWEDYLKASGRRVFAPLPVVDTAYNVRFAGDGPASCTTWLIAARPRSSKYSRCGSLPGYYLRTPGDPRSGRVGGKPLGVMRRIVLDYSGSGDLIADPCAGQATTLLAAMLEGREAIGAECDPETHALGVARLDAAEPSRASSGTQLVFLH